MFKVGLTGTIGSGKTLVTQVFSVLGIPVYQADIQAKRILDQPVVTELVVKKFGSHLKDEQGKIIRSVLASSIFADEEKRLWLNAQIHPLVRADFECWTSLQHHAPYVIQEAAILLETGFDVFFDRIVVVTAPEDLRIRRVQQRDGLTENQVRERMNSQWTDEEKQSRADFIIFNDEQQMLITQILKVHNSILQLI